MKFRSSAGANVEEPEQTVLTPKQQQYRKLRTLATGGIAAGIVLLIGVAITVSILLTNNKDGTRSSITSSESSNGGDDSITNTTNATTAVTAVPTSVPVATIPPSIAVVNETIIDDDDTNSTNTTITLSPTPSVGIVVPENNSTNTTANVTTTAPVPVAAPVVVVAPTPTPIVLIPTTMSPTYLNEPTTTVFYAHGDIPYEADQTLILEQQMKAVPLDAEFVIFVGDLRDAGEDKPCVQEEFDMASYYFQMSHAPVFVIQGDNDVSDCPNYEEGKAMWYNEFVGFESKYWNHTFDIQRHDGYPDNFAFVHKYTLFIGLNIIGGDTRDVVEWETRLTAEAAWTIEQIQQYRMQYTNFTHVGRVVIFGHANPGSRHASFFQSIASYIKYDINNTMPIVYVNGDKHEWMYTPNFYDQPSWLRIGVTGLGAEPLLRITVEADGTYIPPEDAYDIERFLR